MEIILTNIRVSEHLSNATTAFEAALWIDGVRVGKVGNYGQGGPNYHVFANESSKKLIDQADLYCRSLPPKTFPSGGPGGTALIVPMSLQTVIDGIVFGYQCDQDLLSFQKKMENNMKCSILFGVPDKWYKKMRYTIPIELLCRHPKGIEILKTDLHTKILPLLTDGKKILNTNLPPDIIPLLGVPPEYWLELPKNDGEGVCKSESTNYYRAGKNGHLWNAQTK